MRLYLSLCGIFTSAYRYNPSPKYLPTKYSVLAKSFRYYNVYKYTYTPVPYLCVFKTFSPPEISTIKNSVLVNFPYYVNEIIKDSKIP